MRDISLRPVLWVGSSLKDLKSLPVEVKKHSGTPSEIFRKREIQATQSHLNTSANLGYQKYWLMNEKGLLGLYTP